MNPKLENVHPTLIRKWLVIQTDMRKRLPKDWDIEIFEGHRTLVKQIEYIRRGVSWVKNPKKAPHVLLPSKAIDAVFKYKGIWTWTAPIFVTLVTGKSKKLSGWDLLDLECIAHGLKRIRIKFGYHVEDCPHIELTTEDYNGTN